MFVDVIFIVFLIFINAFFVASEISLLSARKSHLDSITKKSGLTSRAIRSNIKNLSLFVTAMQVGNTFISIAVGWRGQVLVNNLITYYFHPYIVRYPLLDNKFLTSIIPFLIITGTLMIFGELIPKKLAMNHPERYALVFAIPVVLYSKVFGPFIVFVNRFTDALLKPLGLNGQKKDVPFSEAELKLIINQSVKDGIIPPSLQSLVFNSLRLKNIKSRDGMHNHSSVVSFPTHATINQIHREISRNKHRFLRYIVHHKTRDNIVGFIETSDLLIPNGKNRNISLKDTNIIKRAILASHESSLDEILSYMLQDKTFVAIIQENEKPKGVVTINTITDELTKRFD